MKLKEFFISTSKKTKKEKLFFETKPRIK